MKVQGAVANAAVKRLKNRDESRSVYGVSGMLGMKKLIGFCTLLLLSVSHSTAFQFKNVLTHYWIGEEVVLTCHAKVRHIDWMWDMTFRPSPNLSDDQRVDDVRTTLDCIAKGGQCNPIVGSLPEMNPKIFDTYVLDSPYLVVELNTKYQFVIPKFPSEDEQDLNLLRLERDKVTPIMGAGREEHFVLMGQYIVDETHQHDVLVLQKNTDEIEMIEFLDSDGLRIFRIRGNNFMLIDTQGGDSIEIEHGFCEWKKGK